jgi:ABC-type branched-subunit amino acid transport system ATPase component/ABC-type branched-subunit amino acid transport system permease subunit
MSQVLLFAVLGLGSGGLYVLLSLGIVLEYKSTGVVNFAQGAIAMVGTYMYYDLSHRHGLPYVPSLLLGMATAALVGVLIQFVVMRPLRQASALTRLIATLAILVILEEVVSHIFPQSAPINIASELPTTTWRILGWTIGWDITWIFVIAVSLVFILAAVYRITRFGRATNAIAENPRAAALLGFSPDTIAGINWAIGGALAGLAGILLVPITGLQVEEYTLLVLPAIAAAMVGGLESFQLALVGALLIGVLQSEAERYLSSTAGIADSIPFFLIVALLLFRGKALPARGYVSARLPRVGQGIVRPKVLIPLIVGAVLIMQYGLNPNWLDAVTTTTGTALILLSLVVLVGYTGQLSLAQGAFAGVGAWAAGRLVADYHPTFLLGLAYGVVVALLVGLIVGFIALRARGVNLAIATLGLAVAANDLIFQNPSVTGGINGTTVGNPTIAGLDINAITHPNRYAITGFVIFVLLCLMVANIRRGRTGRRLLAVRTNERAAASLGISVTGAKLYAFTIAGGIAAVGGVLLAFQSPTIDYTVGWDPFTSINYLTLAVVGGIGWIAGPAIGGTGQTGSLGAQLLGLISQGLVGYLVLIGGVLLLITLIQAPDGLAALNYEQGRKLLVHLRRLRQGHDRQQKSEVPPVAEQGEPIASLAEGGINVVGKPLTLDVTDATVRFGGLVALDTVSLRVEPGEVVGLIGPNGAGKTTFVDAVTGFVELRAGSVRLGGKEINKLKAHERARVGLVRSFQSLELLSDMTIINNLRCASDPRDMQSYLLDMVHPVDPPLSEATAEAIREFGLGPYLDEFPTSLPYAKRRLVAIARAVAMAPSVLLLDEPAAGLDRHQRPELVGLIRRLAESYGIGVLLIEHDVDMVLSACDRIYALAYGRLIGAGTPEEIRNDPAVVAAYIGTGAKSTAAADVTG